jgi:hypothetical protein
VQSNECLYENQRKKGIMNSNTDKNNIGSQWVIKVNN